MNGINCFSSTARSAQEPTRARAKTLPAVLPPRRSHGRARRRCSPTPPPRGEPGWVRRSPVPLVTAVPTTARPPLRSSPLALPNEKKTKSWHIIWRKIHKRRRRRKKKDVRPTVLVGTEYCTWEAQETMYVELYVDCFFECFCGVRYDVRVLTVYPYAAYRMPAGSRAREHASTRPGWLGAAAPPESRPSRTRWYYYSRTRRERR